MDLAETVKPHPLSPTAPMRDRFAAFIMDHVIILYLVIAWGYSLNFYLKGSFDPTPAFGGESLLIFLAGIGGIIFLYFLLSEGIVGTTLGKSFCRLTIVRRSGGTPSVIAIFARNLFRFVDYTLLPISAIMMEGTKNQLRIGDIFSGTMVIKQQLQLQAIETFDTSRLATATRRTIAFLFDLIFFAAFAGAYLLLIVPGKGWPAVVFINLTPVVACAYFILPELLTGMTPGKVITAIRVIEDDGRPVNFAGSLLRTLFRLIDNNPFGFLCVFLGPKKQRIGDIMGGTLVIRKGPGLRQFMVFIIMLLVIAGLGFLAYNNPHNLLKEPYKVVPQIFYNLI